MIESFLKKRNKSKIYKDIRKYSGNFLSLNDIKKLDKNRLVFFGNHLYNHYNAINISDENNLITDKIIDEALQSKTQLYDKNSDYH